MSESAGIHDSRLSGFALVCQELQAVYGAALAGGNFKASRAIVSLIA